MRRLCALAIVAGMATAASMPAAAANHAPAVAVVFHVRPPADDDAALATADVALRAPEEIGEPLAALRRHAGAHVAFAITPAYLAALDRAAHGALNDAALRTIAGQGAVAQTRLMAIFARHRPLDAALARTQWGARYLTLATSAANLLSGDRSSPFSATDLAEFAADDARVVLAASGTSTAGGSAASSFADLARADRQVEDALRSGVRSGSVDVVALPDGEPVLPLLIDAGGKSPSDGHYVLVGAASDARWSTDQAVRAVDAFVGGSQRAGLYAPHGAYDDAVGALIQSTGASYALFSDRVVHGMGGAGTEGGIEAADAASLRGYALTVAKGVTLPTFFWSEADSADVDTALGADTAMAQQLVQAAHRASDRFGGGSGGLLTLRLEADGAWAQRPDARAVVEHFTATLASGAAGTSTTPRDFLRGRPPLSPAYGFPPAAENGSLAFWMGSVDQASLWNALAAARRAAGGDAAIARPAVRPLLVQAESGGWYSSVGAPGIAAGDNRIEAFRALIAAIYRAAGLTPPENIAPLRASPPSPSPVPSASPSGKRLL